jgi:hypothetical protein
VKINHQLENMIRYGEYCIIVILSVAAMQEYGFLFNIEVTHFNIAHLARTNEQIVQNITSQEIMLVVLSEPGLNI